MEIFYKRLNTALLFILVLFCTFVVFTSKDPNEAEAADIYTDLGIGPNGNVTVIDKRFYLKFREPDQNVFDDEPGEEVGAFNVDFVSDGNNGKGDAAAFKARQALFPAITKIPIPLEIAIAPNGAYIDAPGTPVYKSVNKITTARGTYCTDNPLEGDDCLLKAISTSLWENAIRLEVTATNGSAVFGKTNMIPDTSGNRWSTLLNSLDFLKNVRLVFDDANTPDQSRASVGSLSFWGDDELQQIARVNGKLKYFVTSEVEKIEVTRGVEYSVQQFAAQLPGNIRDKVGFSNLYFKAEEDGISTVPYYDPKRKDEINTANTNLLTGILATLFPKEDKVQRRLGVHVPLRKVEEADQFGAAYDFCKATQKLGIGTAHNADWVVSTFKDDAYEPQCRTRNTPAPSGPFTGPTPTPRRDCSPNAVDDDRQSKFDRMGAEDRRCLDAVYQYQGEEIAKNCIDRMVDGQSGCDAFSIEEEELTFTQVEDPRDIAVSLGAYLRNSVFQDFDRNLKGPFINYLSPIFCAKLNITYQVGAGEDYIYRQGGGPGYGNETVDNQYCVVGAILSNYSWVMQEQSDNFSLKNFDDSINQYKEALTCDKKEIANFGASPVFSDNPSPDGQNLVYKVMDNPDDGMGGYGGMFDVDSVMLYHGNDPISLNDIIREYNLCLEYGTDGSCKRENKCLEMNPNGTCKRWEQKFTPIKKYGEYDLKVMSGSDNRPKYVVFQTQRIDSDPATARNEGETKAGSGPRRTLLCRLDYAFHGKQKPQNVRLCYEVDKSETEWFRAKGVLTTINEGSKSVDYVSLISQTDNGGVVAQVIKVDQDNIARSTKFDKVTIKGATEISESVPLMEIQPVNNAIAILSLEDNIEIEGQSSDIRLYVFNPATQKVTFMNHLCRGINTARGLCQLVKNNRHPLTAKIVYQRDLSLLKVVVLGGNTGLVFTPDLKGEESITAKLFIFNKDNKIVGRELPGGEDRSKDPRELPEEARDFITMNETRNDIVVIDDAVFAPDGQTLHVFASSKIASYMLRIREPEASIAREVATICGNGIPANNCLITQQKEFNPDTFVWDCSDYFGTGVCGSKAMGLVGYPKVLHAIINPDGKISAWYQYTYMSKHVIFFSHDFEYSLSGVYKRFGTTNEFSNVYVPRRLSGEELSKRTPNTGLFESTIISNRPYWGPRYMLGTHLIQNAEGSLGGIIREILSPAMRGDKAECMKILNSKVTNNDKFYNIPGVQKPFFVNTEYVPGTGGPGGGSSINPGQYCEESWCVPDSVSIYNNQRFRKTSEGGQMTNQEFDLIVNETTKWMNERYRNNGKGDYRPYVTTLCDESQKAGIPCQVMIGIWLQESTGSQGPNAFNCIGFASDFNTQARCGVTSIYNGGCFFDGGPKRDGKPCDGTKFFSGPGSVFTPNAGLPTSQARGQCEAATRFSAIMNKYTPLDKRINFNNQCNRGLVEREDNDWSVENEIELCKDGNYAEGAGPGDAKNDAAVTSARWPSGKLTGAGTRKNLKFAIETLNTRYKTAGIGTELVLPVSDACYPGGGVPNPGGDPGADASDYDQTTQKAVVEMDFAEWSNNAEAGHAQIAVDQLLSNNRFGRDSQYTDLNKVPTTRTIVVPQNDVFSFYAATGALSGDTINGLKGFYKDDFNFNRGTGLVGGGMCELATGFRVNANRMLELGSTNNYVFRENGPAYFGMGGARGNYRRHQYKNPIQHIEHSDVGVNSYNKLLKGASATTHAMSPNQVTGTTSGQSVDRTKFVSIWLEAGAIQDLKIFHNRSAEEKLIIIVDKVPDKNGKTGIKSQKIRITMYYGKLKANATPVPASDTTKINGKSSFIMLDRQKYL